MTMYTLENNPRNQLFDLIQIDEIHAIIIQQNQTHEEVDAEDFAAQLYFAWDKNNSQNVIFQQTPNYFKNPMVFLIHLTRALKQFKADFTFDEILEGIRPYYDKETLNISVNIDVDITCAKAILKQI